MTTSLILEPDELRDITGGYTRQAEQLRILHQRGFHRAAIIHGRLILERSHYEAVTRGASGPTNRPRPKRTSELAREAA